MTASTERVLAGRVPARRVPDFFIVGQHKSGTTALYEMLRRHPQIYMPDMKEPRFFASDLRSRTAASAIAAAQPGARIIAILREPASFLRSLHLHLLQEGVETHQDFR